MNVQRKIDLCPYTAEQVERIRADALARRDRILAKPATDYVSLASQQRAARYQYEIIWATTGVQDYLAGHEGFEDSIYDLMDLLEGDNSHPAPSYLMGRLP